AEQRSAQAALELGRAAGGGGGRRAAGDGGQRGGGVDDLQITHGSSPQTAVWESVPDRAGFGRAGWAGRGDRRCRISSRVPNISTTPSRSTRSRSIWTRA